MGDAIFTTLSAEETRQALASGDVLLVDVREPVEFASERVEGALLFPLSSFDTKKLPQDEKRAVVLYCGSGKRSADAMKRCRDAGVVVRGHLGGGLSAWKAAGLPTIAIDPATGRIREQR